MNETTRQVLGWVLSFDVNRVSIERASFSELSTFQDKVHDLADLDPDFTTDLDPIQEDASNLVQWNELQEAVRSQVRIDGQTAKEFLNDFYEFKLCDECGGNSKDHMARPGPFGKWHAWCLGDAPEGARFEVELLRSDGHWHSYAVSLVDVDNGARLGHDVVTFEAVGLNNLAVEGHFKRAMEPDSRRVQETAASVLREYRRKVHNAE